MSEQQLNSLDRFRKRSPNLILEQHGSCEVPAGCGGVVLRWRNPQAARPVRVHLYASGRATSWINGQPLVRGTIDLAPGRHVFALAIEARDRSLLLRASLTHDSEGLTAKGPIEIELPLRTLSQPDGTWKATLQQPGEGWQVLDYDEEGWAALVGCAIPQPPSSHEGRYQWHCCEEAGAPGLGVALPEEQARAGPVWVRKVFEVPSPRVR